MSQSLRGKTLRLPALPATDCVSGNSASDESRPGAVAAAIQSLPLDVGTALSPTLLVHPAGANDSLCGGGPGPWAPGSMMCGLVVKYGQMGIQCDLCMNWFHAQCQDVPKAAYNALDKYDTVAFICMGCKRLPPLQKLHRSTTTDVAVQTFSTNSNICASAELSASIPLVDCSVQTDTGPEVPTSPLPYTRDAHQGVLTELAEKVHGLEKTLRDHTALLSHVLSAQGTAQTEDGTTLTSGSEKRSFAEVLKGSRGNVTQCSSYPQAEGPSLPTHVPSQGPSASRDYRQAVREELLEQEERRKRKASLVIRGLHASSPADAVTKFAEITQFLVGERIELSDTCRIKNEADLIRGNVHDQRQRRLILDSARELKDSRYSNVYIRRDLTFQQRENLKARRLAAPAQGGQGPVRNMHSMVINRSTNSVRDTRQAAQPPIYQETVPKQVWNPHDDRTITSVPDAGSSHPGEEPRTGRRVDSSVGTSAQQTTPQPGHQPDNQEAQQSEREPRLDVRPRDQQGQGDHSGEDPVVNSGN